MSQHHRTRHTTIDVGGLEIFYRHAGDPEAPAVLLLHGFPTSSYMFRDVIEPLAESAYVVAPDLPGFGFSDAPPIGVYEYTFAHLADTMTAFVDAIGLDRYFLYVNDYGSAVAYRMATRRPDRVLGLVVQNGNAHEAGLGAPWDSARAYWADPSPENRARIPDWLDLETTREQYVGRQPPEVAELYPPESWHLDHARMSRPGNTELQFDLFVDYATHVDRFPVIEAYHREHQPPCLVLWGRHDPYFEIDEILAYHRVLDSVELHVFDSGHMLLETHHREAARLMCDFVSTVDTGGRG